MCEFCVGRLQNRQGVLPIISFYDLKTGVGEDIGRYHAHKRLVLDDQNNGRFYLHESLISRGGFQFRITFRYRS